MQPVALSTSRPLPEALKMSGGSIRQNPEGGLSPSLAITRSNAAVHGRETLVPGRLLHGVVPGALLDACTFWQVKCCLLDTV